MKTGPKDRIKVRRFNCSKWPSVVILTLISLASIRADHPEGTREARRVKIPSEITPSPETAGTSQETDTSVQAVFLPPGYEIFGFGGRYFNPWGSKRGKLLPHPANPLLEARMLDKKRQFTSWGGRKRSENEATGTSDITSGDVDNQEYDAKSQGVRNEAFPVVQLSTFGSGGEKRSFNAWGGKKRSGFISRDGKRNGFGPWGGKRGGFNSWGGKKRSGFDASSPSIRDRFTEELNDDLDIGSGRIGVLQRDFGPWGGKRDFGAWAGKRGFNSWGGKRDFSTWGGRKRTPDSMDDPLPSNGILRLDVIPHDFATFEK